MNYLATIYRLHDAIKWDGVIFSDWFTPDTDCSLVPIMSSYAVQGYSYVLCLWEGTLSAGTHAQRNSFRMVWAILDYTGLVSQGLGFILFSITPYFFLVTPPAALLTLFFAARDL